MVDVSNFPHVPGAKINDCRGIFYIRLSIFLVYSSTVCMKKNAGDLSNLYIIHVNPSLRVNKCLALKSVLLLLLYLHNKSTLQVKAGNNSVLRSDLMFVSSVHASLQTLLRLTGQSLEK